MTTNKATELLIEIKHVLNKSEVNLMELSRVSGVAYNTLRALKAGTANPTIRLLEKIYSACVQPHKDNITCENCEYCLHFDNVNHCYSCEHHPGGFKTDPSACILYVKWEGKE